MVLKNFKCIAIGRNATSLSNTSVGVGGSSNMVLALNSSQFKADGNGCYYNIGVSGVYVNIGFGTTPVTYNDYKLADDNILDNNFLLTYVSDSWTVSGDQSIVTVTTLYKNETENNITVTEMGVCDKTYSNGNPAYQCLIARKVLDNPVVMQPGKTYSFSYNISL